MSVTDAVLLLVILIGALSLGAVGLSVLLDTPEHVDARRRNRAGDEW